MANRARGAASFDEAGASREDGLASGRGVACRGVPGRVAATGGAPDGSARCPRRCKAGAVTGTMSAKRWRADHRVSTGAGAAHLHGGRKAGRHDGNLVPAGGRRMTARAFPGQGATRRDGASCGVRGRAAFLERRRGDDGRRGLAISTEGPMRVRRRRVQSMRARRSRAVGFHGSTRGAGASSAKEGHRQGGIARHRHVGDFAAPGRCGRRGSGASRGTLHGLAPRSAARGFPCPQRQGGRRWLAPDAE